jgi:hypothetical protein
MQRVLMSFKVADVKAIEEIRLTRPSDGSVQTMRVLPISSDIVEDAVRSALANAAKQPVPLPPTAQIYVCTIRDELPPSKQDDGTLEERVVYGICVSSEPATVEVIEPHFVKPHDVRVG